ncbi:uncharacterized protein BDW70DRAFT_145708 [Aspergillus foveolatus]|uniref:uncharacterized protein n=1 Tax=Aspergillus foveolatus TaxID=210207 RepID=UPI003CCD5937
MSSESDQTGFISVKRTDWHVGEAQPGNTQPELRFEHGNSAIGYLTSEGDEHWAYARPNWNAAIRININWCPGGMAMQDASTGALLTRSGDWVKWAHGGSHDDTLVTYQKNPNNGTYWLKFKSGGSWLCTSKEGELNVKNEGEYAQFRHRSMFFAP